MSLRGFLELTRPRLLPSALCDVIAGAALGLAFANSDDAIAWRVSDLDAWTFVRGLLFALFVYAAGMVLNDVFDADEDCRLGRDKPLVERRVRRTQAGVFGLVLLAAALAFAPWRQLGWVPAAIVVGVLVYDWGWRFPGSSSSRPILPSAVALGACRGLNLYGGTLLIATSPAGDDLLSTPLPEIVIYGIYTALAVWHGSLEDRETSPAQSNAVLAPALLLPVLACLRLPYPLLGAAAALPGLFALWRSSTSGPAWLPKRTGILLRGLARFTLAVALAAGAWLSASLIAIPAFALPWLLTRTRWS